MKLILRVALAAVALALGYWAWTFFFPNPKTVIRHRLEKLAQVASFASDEGTIVRLAGAQKLIGYLTDNVQVKADAPGLDGRNFENRDDLIQAATAARTMVKSLKVRFSDMNIEVTAGKEEALVDLALTADVGGEKDSIFQEMKFSMKKVDGTWLVARIENVKSLR